jgi:hypothetical protein
MGTETAGTHCLCTDMSVASTAATKVRRRQRRSSGPRLASTRERCRMEEPTEEWCASSTLTSLWRSASMEQLLTWKALVVPGCSTS